MHNQKPAPWSVEKKYLVDSAEKHSKVTSKFENGTAEREMLCRHRRTKLHRHLLNPWTRFSDS